MEAAADWAESLGFQRISDYVFTKDLPANSEIVIDTLAGTISYPPEMRVVSKTTSNLSQFENLVVLDCVVRLLEDNYPASSITLEPTWKLGRGASGGRADILVRDKLESPYLLIECKTPGNEYETEWKKTEQGRGQLFSYAQQETSVRFLVLYSSWIDNKKLNNEYKIIPHTDDEVVLSRGRQLPSFRDSKSVQDRFNAWANTYHKHAFSAGLFSGRGTPYRVGQAPRRTGDLHDLNERDRAQKSGEFATILRRYNVSARENAFDVLVNLFVAKLTDELENADDLNFTWRGSAVETPYDLVERLEVLYRRGMKRFLNEDVAYVESDDIDNAMRFIVSTPDAAKNAISELFKRQKFYSKSNFGLLDVHNEELFLLNSAILIELVDMWQSSRLSVAGNTESTQALGDMFEIFLDEGIKQTEGQYFTPWTICDFIIDCIPEIGSGEHPHVLDFACGAGHFLTQYFSKRIAPIEDEPERALAASRLYGIEKEYRLSKISKVASSMYGAVDSNIIYADALEKSVFLKERLGGRFDLLLSNPPYSVDGFLTQLDSESIDSLSISGLISNPEKFDRIEEAFLQRASEALDAGGYAALIFPESFYDNVSNDANLTRDLLFSNFNVGALVKLPGGTFSMTGTSTWVAFLKRRPDGPSSAEHVRLRVDAIFAQGKYAIDDSSYDDSWILKEYLSKFLLDEIEFLAIVEKDLQYFVSHECTFEELIDSAASRFMRAADADDASLSPSDVQVRTQVLPRVLDAVVDDHKERLRKFWTLKTNGDCLIVSPDAHVKQDKKLITDYLGYTWSKRKGHQGIRLLDSAASWQGSPLFPSVENPLPYAVKSLLSCGKLQEDDVASLQEFFTGRATMDLREGVDIVSWPSSDTPLAVDLIPVPDISDISKFPVAMVDRVLDVFYGKGLTESERVADGHIPVFGSNGPVGYHDLPIFNDSGVVVGRKGSVGLAALALTPSFPIDTTYFLRPRYPKRLLTEFVYLVIDHHHFPSGGSGVPSLSKSKLNRYQIPIPPVSKQVEIVDAVFKYEGSDRNDPFAVNRHKDKEFRYSLLKRELGW